mmetsp:Transcript_21909/g.43073  ORF Transcript_21909/g.43073 Transcript_21909/m.43073 type:complete len:92 (+) Transcript_21909:236-511(+)
MTGPSWVFDSKTEYFSSFEQSASREAVEKSTCVVSLVLASVYSSKIWNNELCLFSQQHTAKANSCDRTKSFVALFSDTLFSPSCGLAATRS